MQDLFQDFRQAAITGSRKEPDISALVFPLGYRKQLLETGVDGGSFWWKSTTALHLRARLYCEGYALRSSVVSDNYPEMKLCSFAQIHLMVFAPCQSHLSILGPECVLDIKQYMSLYSKTYRWCELNHVELVIAHSKKRVFNPKYWRRQLQISSWPKH